MEDQMILPWELIDPLDKLYVPDYILEIAHEVCQYYDMTVSDMEVINVKSHKGGAIWRIDTDKGPRSLKLLHRRPTRSLFSLGAQEYLVKEKHARIPQIIPTVDRELYVEMGGKLWFVAEWISTLEPAGTDLEGMKERSYAIGEFHRLSKGYVPPKGAELASRLQRWPKTYKKIINKMEWFRDITNGYSQMPASSKILSVLDTFEEQAIEALKRLEQSVYFDLANRGIEEWGLVHQDYGWSNGQKGEEGIWIIDLDGVAFDLPIRDLGKLISDTTDKLGKWDYNWVNEMIQAYHEANPIDDDMYQMLLIDMSLPNLFYKSVKEMVYKPTVFLDEQLEEVVDRIVSIDQTKWPVLQELNRPWEGGKK
ncbi:CotS family spore coat protein [Bacillus sp. FJAT-45350]|uniref:CotS family spore coat protein n=1 Tax=Bacillus sp. FJAT-45350 TaxID=2011014 RepID=UPI000BB7426E|nr:CotS family spore coat protein [Bacillus sp. FJAT-45350]